MSVRFGVTRAKFASRMAWNRRRTDGRPRPVPTLHPHQPTVSFNAVPPGDELLLGIRPEELELSDPTEYGVKGFSQDYAAQLSRPIQPHYEEVDTGQSAAFPMKLLRRR